MLLIVVVCLVSFCYVLLFCMVCVKKGVKLRVYSSSQGKKLIYFFDFIDVFEKSLFCCSLFYEYKNVKIYCYWNSVSYKGYSGWVL